MRDSLPTSTRVFTYLGAGIPVHCYEHLAIVSRGGAPASWGAGFVQEGLQRGHHCSVTTATPRAGFVVRLQELGVNVEQHLADRTLQFPLERRDGDGFLACAKRFFAEAEGAGAPAVRWLEEGMGARPAGVSINEFFELHSHLNYLVKQYPAMALCQYDIEHLEIPQLFSALAVHRHLLVEGILVRDNPFYVPAERFLAMDPDDRERDLCDVFREVGFDLEKLLAVLAGYGRLQRSAV